MTDKQIIINGVDVSGCDFLAKKDDYCSYSGVTYAYKGQCMCSDEEMCKEHPKCFYKKVLKQLKRKEQKCEELKKNLHQNFKEKDGLHIIIDRLLEAGGYDTNTASAEDFEDVYKNMRYEQQQLDQLKQTLAEIKEIAERELNVPQMVKLLHVQKLSKSYKKSENVR